MPSLAADRLADWEETVCVAFAALRRAMRHDDVRISLAAAQEVVKLETARMRHGRPISGTGPKPATTSFPLSSVSGEKAEVRGSALWADEERVASAERPLTRPSATLSPAQPGERAEEWGEMPPGVTPELADRLFAHFDHLAVTLPADLTDAEWEAAALSSLTGGLASAGDPGLPGEAPRKRFAVPQHGPVPVGVRRLDPPTPGTRSARSPTTTGRSPTTPAGPSGGDGARVGDRFHEFHKFGPLVFE